MIDEPDEPEKSSRLCSLCSSTFGIQIALLVLATLGIWPTQCGADDWPRWRGSDGNAVSHESPLPVRWSTTENVRWKAAVPGEGVSSPIVWQNRVFVTSAFEDGARRAVHCLDRRSGEMLWSQAMRDESPERASSMAGHAASTPATDGQRAIAFFGNAGVCCFDFEGKQLWHRKLGDFDSELGLASSPVIFRERVILVCDHDGDRFTSFDSFLIALDLRSGETVWKTDRRGLFRSWSTPIIVPSADGRQEMIVNAQDHLRGYDPDTGKPLWQVGGMTGWVTPSPVFGHGLIFAASGRDGPTMAVRPGGDGDVSSTHVVWKQDRGAPYVCSPVLYGDFLYVISEQGILTCHVAGTGQNQYLRRLEGKFLGSPVAGAGKVYLTNDAGTTFVIKAGGDFELLAQNALEEYCIASPAIASGELFIRTEHHLYCIASFSEQRR